MSKKVVQTAAEGLNPNPRPTESSDDLGSLPGNKPSNVDPTSDTTSQPNPLQRTISIGRQGTVIQAAPNELEKLRPSGD